MNFILFVWIQTKSKDAIKSEGDIVVAAGRIVEGVHAGRGSVVTTAVASATMILSAGATSTAAARSTSARSTASKVNSDDSRSLSQALATIFSTARLYLQI